ncbi:enoyl-CoA hydratase/isomerase family protein, partial [Klebsiella pneumoniae]|uniref:enoyl-CoA hydratase/isomerase family protein n=2 Tax=Pseudomonadota TaxID=1224 RepID=UPI001953326B
IVAAGNATFGQPEIRLGLIPGAGGIQRLTALLGKSRAMRLLLTGETISGTDAFDWGIASHGTPAGESLATAEDLAAKLAKGAPLA